MTDQRQHRGAHPADHELFTPAQLPRLQLAVKELSWLLTRDYAVTSALKLVGDRHELPHRQRLAVARAACSDQHQLHCRERCLPLDSIRNQSLLIDGFNLIVTIEAALSGGVLLRCRDSCVRDLASVHGSYRSVLETESAIELIGATLMSYAPLQINWLLDQPVSNSGRLKQKLLAKATERDWNWSVEVVMNPDKALRESSQIIVSSDSVILDGNIRWLNVADWLLEHHLNQAWVIDLSR